jgi:alkylation response protein AidB-like acyl-CoA dehydrogenase
VVDAADLEPAVDEAAAAAARPLGIALGRQAAAWEILGAAEGALALAVEHAVGRVQFGQPIGTFQAVRHLLAWAFADAAAVEAVAGSALALGGDAPPRYDQVVKAIAGRNARRVCERALQVLGGIGFTAELDHHHFHSRVLTLDSLLGSSTALTAGLGAWIRAERADPGFARAALLASA